jgi:hypothetical protein
MFNTKGQEIKTGGGIQKSIQPGVVYAHIYSGQVRTAKTGKKCLELVLETPEIENFEGWAIDKNDQEGPKFKGQSSRVTATMYTDEHSSDSPARNEIIYKLLFIASELGLRDDADDVNAKSIEEWVEKVINIVKGKDLYFFLKGTEDEYNGKTIVKLSLPKFKFASINESGLDKFDKNNQYHYKALKTKSVSGFEPASDDFDM